MQLLLKINKWVKKFSLFCAVVIFCLVGLSVLAQIIFRYIFLVSLNWVDEFARYGLVWFVFMGGAASIDSIEETCVTYLKQKIPHSILRWIELLFHASMVFFLVVLIRTGLEFAEMGKLARTLSLGGISQYIPFMAIPVGSVFIAFSYAVRTITDFRGIKEPSFDKDDQQPGEETA